MRLQPVLLNQKPVLKKTTSLPGLALLSIVLTLLSFHPATSFAQCSLSCQGSLNIGLDNNGEALITPQMLLADLDCDPDDFTVDVTLNGVSLGDLITCDYIGYALTANAIQNATGNSCSTTIYVSDYNAPQIFCTDTILACVQDYTPAVAGYPVATDNCSSFTNADFSYSDIFTDLPCYTLVGADTITAQVERKWWVTDDYGWADTCVQMIYIRQADLNDIVFPVNLNGSSAPILDCTEDPTDLNLTGIPTIDGLPIPLVGLCDVTVTHADETVGICLPAGYNILRTWTAIDWCSGNSITHAQVIKVMDTTAPVLTCPADMTVGSSIISCGATITLPTAAATDDCSDFEVTASWAFGTGQGPFYNVPLGTHDVTYTATDDCGNTSSCLMQLTVEDNVPPVNICKTFLTVNISSGGTAAVPASTFDDGSFDNCGVDYFEVKRDSDPFGSFVIFDCNDVGAAAVNVTFRVYDAVGNYNDCVASVSVHDNIYPVMNCPATVYIECDLDYLDTLLTGVPVVSDNCGVSSLTYSDNENIDPTCHTGTVNRTWTVTDYSGNTVSCTQLIIVEDNTPVSVTFPTNYSTSICGADTSPAITGEPQVTNDNCESIGISHDDVVFNDPASGCFTILRDWVVVDWCTYVPNSGSTAGYYTHTQLISVNDNEAPVLTCPASFTAPSLNPACGGTYVNIDPVLATDCGNNISINNNSLHADMNGADASGFYPLGTHVITFTADDNCGNIASCSMTLTVEDGLEPNVICFSGLAVSLDATGIATITAEMIDYGSTDNCTAPENLIMSVSPSTFTCDDLGLQNVDLTVIDENGNVGICTGTVDVQDNLGVCGGVTHAISGQVLMYTGANMANVDMYMINGTDTSIVTTDASGQYVFDEAVESDSYTVKPIRTTNVSNGISSFDLILISKHVLGTQELDSPYKIIAADANHSGSVTTFDMVLFKKIILHIDTVFSNNTSWRFVDANYVFPNPGNPFQYTFPEHTFVESIMSDVAAVDFIGVKVGDVNGNASPNGLLDGGEGRTEKDDLIFNFEDQSYKAGEEVIIPFEAATPADLLAYQYTIGFDTDQLELIEVLPGDTDLQTAVTENDFGFTYLDDGFITTNWLNLAEEALEESTQFFQLKFRARQNGQLSTALNVSSEFTRAEAYSGLGTVKEWNVRAMFDKKSTVAENHLYQNYPNPFREHTRIMFELNTSTNLVLSVYDNQGRLVKNIEGFYEAGRHEVSLDRSDIIRNGIYHYSLIIPGKKVLSRKMVVVD